MDRKCDRKWAKSGPYVERECPEVNQKWNARDLQVQGVCAFIFYVHTIFNSLTCQITIEQSADKMNIYISSIMYITLTIALSFKTFLQNFNNEIQI